MALDDRTVQIRSERCGTLNLHRHQVREISQPRFAQVIFEGPRGLTDWLVLKVGRRLDEWKSDERGALSTELNGAEIYCALPATVQAELQMQLRWRDQPGFQVDLGSISELEHRAPRLSLKSWGDDVVVQSSVDPGEFVHLQKLNAQQQSLWLRILWNYQEGKAVIHDRTGLRLGEIPIIKTPALSNSTEASTTQAANEMGVLVRNRGSYLKVEQIRVSEYRGQPRWDGHPADTYLRMGDGTVKSSHVARLDGPTGQLMFDSGESVFMADVAMIELTASAERILSPLEARFADGTFICGELISWGTDGRIAVRSTSSHEPITTTSVGLDEMVLPDSVAVGDDVAPFRLTWHDQKSSRGRISGIEPSGELGWLVAGSSTAVGLNPSFEYSIEAYGKSLPASRPPLREVVYFRDGTSFVADVQAIEGESIDFVSEFTGKRKVSTRGLKALEVLGGSGRIDLEGENWEFIRGSRPTQLSRGSLRISHPVNFRDLNLDHRGRVSFRCEWDEDFLGLMTIHLGDMDRGSNESSILRLMFQQRSLTVRCLQQPACHREFNSLFNRKATVSIRGEGRDLVVWVNGELAFRALLAKPIAEKGIWFQCGSARSTSAGDDSSDAALTLDAIRVGPGAGLENLSLIDVDQKQMLLQVPRRQTEQFPEHVLCALNGDLLRGTLQGVDPHQARFLSHDRQVALDRDQLAAIIWLDPPGKPVEQPQELSTFVEQFHTEDGSTFLLDSIRVRENELIGRHPEVGDVAIPLANLIRLRRPDPSLTSPFADWVLTQPVSVSNLTSGTEDSRFESGTEFPLVGKQVRCSFTLLDGTQYELPQTGNASQIIVFDFWATWCAPCVRALPERYAWTADFPPERLVYVAVNLGEPLPTVTAFSKLRDWKMNLTIDMNGQLAKSFQVRNIPQTIVMRGDGHVSHVFLGSSPTVEAGLMRAIQQQLGLDPNAGND